MFFFLLKLFSCTLIHSYTKITSRALTKYILNTLYIVKMERDDLVFKAKLAEQAERYVFCALLRVARWFLRVDFERRF